MHVRRYIHIYGYIRDDVLLPERKTILKNNKFPPFFFRFFGFFVFFCCFFSLIFIRCLKGNIKPKEENNVLQINFLVFPFFPIYFCFFLYFHTFFGQQPKLNNIHSKFSNIYFPLLFPHPVFHFSYFSNNVFRSRNHNLYGSQYLVLCNKPKNKLRETATVPVVLLTKPFQVSPVLCTLSHKLPLNVESPPTAPEDPQHNDPLEYSILPIKFNFYVILAFSCLNAQSVDTLNIKRQHKYAHTQTHQLMENYENFSIRWIRKTIFSQFHDYIISEPYPLYILMEQIQTE